MTLAFLAVSYAFIVENPLNKSAERQSILTWEPVDVNIARIRAGIKQKELATRLGLNQKTLSAYELGRRKFPPEVVQRILDFLNNYNPPDREEV